MKNVYGKIILDKDDFVRKLVNWQKIFTKEKRVLHE